MKTYKISKEDIKELKPLAVGYKAVKWDLSTNGTSGFRYGEVDEDIVGTIWKVDGAIKECNWGLHFSKDPANVFCFYEPLGYNRYFKVKAYEKVIDTADGLKSVAQIIEFIEEYDIMGFVAEIKRFDRKGDAVSYSNAVSRSAAVSGSDAVSYSNAVSRSTAVSGSDAVRGSAAVSGSDAVRGSAAVSRSAAVHWSAAVNDSTAVSRSTAVSGSDAVRGSAAVSGSDAVSYSNAVRWSTAVNGSYGILNCEAVKNCIFCYKKDAIKYYIFNKKVLKDRFNEVYKKILKFNFRPEYMNWDEVKGNKEWWAFNFERLAINDNPWSSMPEEMLEYIKALPEFNENVFKAITGVEV